MTYDPSDISAKYQDQTVYISNEETDETTPFFFRSVKFVTEPEESKNIYGLEDSGFIDIVEFLTICKSPSFWLEILDAYRDNPNQKLENLPIDEAEKNTLRLLLAYYPRHYGFSETKHPVNVEKENEFIDAYLKIPIISAESQLEPMLSGEGYQYELPF